MPKPLEEQTPAELISHIKELRQEAKTNRVNAQAYDAAFERLKPQEQRGLLNIITKFSEDREMGADLFRQLADTVLGPNSQNDHEEHDMSEDNDTGDTSSEEVPAWAKALVDEFNSVKEQLEASAANSQEAELRGIKAQATELGYSEGTEEWKQFFAIASSDIADGDLNKAHEIFGKIYGEGEKTGDEEESGDGSGETSDSEGGDGEKTGDSEDTGGTKTFPKTGTAGGSGAPGSEGQQELDLTKSGVQAAAEAYLANAESENSTTP